MPRQARAIQWSVLHGKPREARTNAARASFFLSYRACIVSITIEYMDPYGTANFKEDA